MGHAVVFEVPAPVVFGDERVAVPDDDACPAVQVDDDGVRVRVIAGSYGGVDGPVETHSPVTYLHASLPAGRELRIPVVSSQTAMVYTFAGEGDGTLAIYDTDGDEVVITNSGSGASEHLVLAGEPLREPVARYGPFVMNTSEEIETAIEDYQSGRFGAIAR